MKAKQIETGDTYRGREIVEVIKTETEVIFLVSGNQDYTIPVHPDKELPLASKNSRTSEYP